MKIVLTKADNPRAVEPRDLSGYLNGRKTHITGSVKEAKRSAFSLARKEDLVLVCGSLFAVGEFRDGY